MAYNNKNHLRKIIEIQNIVNTEYQKGYSYSDIYLNLIKEKYHISYSTFNNYLSRNAKKEMEELNKKKLNE